MVFVEHAYDDDSVWVWPVEELEPVLVESVVDSDVPTTSGVAAFLVALSQVPWKPPSTCISLQSNIPE